MGADQHCGRVKELIYLRVDRRTLAMAKAYTDKNSVLVENTVLEERTYNLHYTSSSASCTINFPYDIPYGTYYVYIDGKEYVMPHNGGDNRYDDGYIFVDIGTKSLYIQFIGGNTQGSVTVSVIQRTIDANYFPAAFIPSVVALSMADKILELFSQGGGAATSYGESNFWLMVSQNQYSEIHLLLPYLNNSYFNIDGVTRLFDNDDRCTMVCFSFMVVMEGTSYMVNVCIERYDNDAIVTVKVS